MLKIISCALAGALLVVSFAPFYFWWISFIACAILFYYWQHAAARECFICGLAFGYGLFGFGVSWVYISLHTYGGMPLWMGSIAVLGFAGILALFVAGAGFLVATLVPQGGPRRLLIIPFVWIVFEWLKSWVLTGFPWLELGHTQTPSWLAGFAPIGGTYLVSLCVAMLASALIALLTQNTLRVRSLFFIAILGSLAWWADQVRWSVDSGEILEVAVVQPNTPIDLKWQPEFRDRAISSLALKSKQLAEQAPVDLLVWPETAIALYTQQVDSEFWRSITPLGSALLAGIVDAPQPGESYNAAVLNCGGQLQTYRKRHLVPFGEYLPLRFLFGWVLDYLQLPMSDFSSWPGQQSLNCGENIKIALSICYEDAFGSELRQHLGDATLLVNISEDAWFGDSFAPHQRLQIAQMRARELSRPLLRSANTGPSVLIDEQGQVRASTNQFEAATLRYSVQPKSGLTPYTKFGNWIIWFSLLLISWQVVIRKRVD